MTSDYALQLETHPRNPRARIRVLTGTDDGQSFRVTVPMRLKTVEDAVAWLRPEGIPADALRQGEFYFVPSDGPHAVAGCDHGNTPGKIYRYDCGYDEYTDGGSHYRYDVIWNASFSRTHTAADCNAVVKSGSVASVGRKRIASHDFTGRPRYFVRGEVTHAEHGTLVLPCHSDRYQDDPRHRGDWYEVIPNKAHGPFPVRGYGDVD